MSPSAGGSLLAAFFPSGSRRAPRLPPAPPARIRSRGHSTGARFILPGCGGGRPIGARGAGPDRFREALRSLRIPEAGPGAAGLREAGRVRPPRGDGTGRAALPETRVARRRAPIGPRHEARWSGRVNTARGSSLARCKSKRASRAGGYFQSKRRRGASCAQAALRLRFRGDSRGGVLLSQLPLPRAEPLPGLSAAERDGANSAQMPRSAARTTLLSAEPCVLPGSAFPTGDSLQVGGEGRREGPGSKCWA